MAADGGDLEQIRTAFFRRTRRFVAVFYLVIALMAIGVGAYAFATAWRPAAAGVLGGFIAGVAAFLLSPRIPTSARTARVLVVGGPVAGVIVGMFLFDALSARWQAGMAGAFAGYLAATIVGVSSIRRRLARDDELLLRQKRLGFDPEHPWRWLRG